MNQTTYIALTDNGTFKSGTNLSELCSKLLDIKITDNGNVLINGKLDSISYNMREWTKQEAIKDFSYTRMISILKPKVKIFKATEL